MGRLLAAEQQRVRRRREQQAARTQQARALGDHRRGVGHVLEHVEGAHDVEGGIGER